MIKWFLCLIGVVFTAYGGYLLVDPLYLVNLLALGDGKPMLIEIRAMYGGLQLGVGLLMLLAAFRGGIAEQRSACLVLILCFGGLVAGRAIGLLLEGGDTYNLGAIVFESSSLLLACYGFARLRVTSTA